MTDPKSMIVQLTVGELESIVVGAVARGVAQAQPEALEYLTLELAAKLLKVDERTAITYVKTRGLVASKLGHEWRFAREDLKRWMVENHFKVKKAG